MIRAFVIFTHIFTASRKVPGTQDESLLEMSNLKLGERKQLGESEAEAEGRPRPRF